MEEEVDKKIEFFKLILEKKGEAVDPIEVFSHIKSLNLEKEERCYRIKKGQYNLMMFHNEDLDVYKPIKFTLGSGKKRDLPCLEEKGKTEPLEIADKSLFEPTHMMLFDNNILGAEFNYYGPRASGLKSYILKLAQTYVDTVDVIQLPNPNFSETLDKMGNIKLFELRVHRNFGELFKEEDPGIFNILGAITKSTDSEEIGVYIRSSKHIRGIKWRNLINFFKKGDLTSINKAEVKAVNTDTNRVEPFNLLEQHIISTKRVVRHDDRYKRVDSSSMFAAIKSSFNDKKSDIDGIIRKPKKKQKDLHHWTG